MAGKSEVLYFKGKGKWVTTIKVDKYGFWKVQLYLSPEDLTKFKELRVEKGIKTQLKKDEDGYYIVLRRPQSKVIRGKVVAFTPPLVMKADNSPWDNTSIGNGSDLTVKLIIYPYKNPQSQQTEHAFRLEAIRVDNLVPFAPLKDMEDPIARAQAAGLEQQTPQKAPF